MATTSRGRMRGASRSMIGARGLGQDRLLLHVAADDEGFALAAIADGMGGHGGGARAAELALGALEGRRSRLASATGAALDAVLDQAFEVMSEDIAELRGRGLEYERAGTTLTCVAVRAGRAHVRHVGDSRLWHLRAGRVALLTEDHSLAWKLHRAGVLDEEERDASPLRHRLYRFLGRPGVTPERHDFPMASGDAILLVSDGAPVEAGTLAALDPPYDPEAMLSVALASELVTADDASAVALVMD